MYSDPTLQGAITNPPALDQRYESAKNQSKIERELETGFVEEEEDDGDAEESVEETTVASVNYNKFEGEISSANSSIPGRVGIPKAETDSLPVATGRRCWVIY